MLSLTLHPYKPTVRSKCALRTAFELTVAFASVFVDSVDLYQLSRPKLTQFRFLAQHANPLVTWQCHASGEAQGA